MRGMRVQKLLRGYLLNKEGLTKVHGLKTDTGDRQGSWIFANLPAFLASWGFSKNSDSAALYRTENRAQKGRLKGVPR